MTVGTNGASLFQTNLANSSSIAADSNGVLIPGTPALTSVAFQYYLGTDVSNVTGTGTLYSLGSTQDLTQYFDIGSNMTVGGVFTAPTTGVYCFAGSVLLTNCTTPTFGQFRVASSDGSFFNFSLSPVTGSSIYFLAGSVITSLASGATVTFGVIGYGEAMDSEGISGTQPNTWVGGYLITAV